MRLRGVGRHRHTSAPEDVSGNLEGVSWLGDALSAVSRTVQVRVSFEGWLGLDSPADAPPYVVTVTNRGRVPVQVIAAGLNVSGERDPDPFKQGRWQIPGAPAQAVTIDGLHAAQWQVSALDLYRLLVNKGLTAARVEGFARLAASDRPRTSTARTVSRR